ncbi:MAG: hypothetical protein JSR46_04280 [Verrucomicrobia bacterium]|nr:hypothetical protein [Verrucomicrobiota bacterium]
MQDVNVRELAGDLGVGLVGIYLLKNYMPEQDSIAAEILGAAAGALLFNGLFMANQAPIIMLVHAGIGGVLAYFLFPWITSTFLPIKPIQK